MRIREGTLIPRRDGKRIEEFVGRVGTGTTSISVARMLAPLGWVEPAQTPEFDEVVIVLTGELTVMMNGEREQIYRGEMGLVPQGTRVIYRNDGMGPCEYFSICAPAFSVAAAHMEDPRYGAITLSQPPTLPKVASPSAKVAPVSQAPAVRADNHIDIKVSHPKGKAMKPHLLQVAEQYLAAQGLRNAELSISLVTDRAIRKLNKSWRQKDKPTDVLSFPAGDSPKGTPGPKPIGDVVISLDTARRQAKSGKRQLDAEVSRYLAHGILHLLGFDHETEADAAKMAAQEQKLLGKQGMIPAWEDHGSALKVAAPVTMAPVVAAKRAPKAVKRPPTKTRPTAKMAKKVSKKRK